MVKLDLKYGLLFCRVILVYKGKSLEIENVLLDTGSGGTVFKIDVVDKIGITIENNDTIEAIMGVGGSEFVYKKKVDSICLGNLELRDFTIEVGVMDYGFDIKGIVGMDFLKNVGAIIDLDKMTVKDA